MEQPKCTIVFDESNDPTSGSFLFEGETHTMGNALRQAIIPNEKVDFCGYSVPHPAENKMRIRIQARKAEDGSGANIIEILNQGLDDFSRWCGNVENEFNNAFAAFTSQIVK